MIQKSVGCLLIVFAIGLSACRDAGNQRDLRSAESLSLDSLRCGRGGDGGGCSLYDVSLYELITRPAEFDGKRVRVIGFAHFEFEGNGLYPHREDWQQGILHNGVWLEPPNEAANSLSDHYVLVEGRFEARSRGHMGMWSGTIDSVTRIESWGNPPALRVSGKRPR
jgi:hypothetical protein